MNAMCITYGWQKICNCNHLSAPLKYVSNATNSAHPLHDKVLRHSIKCLICTERQKYELSIQFSIVTKCRTEI